MAVRCSKNKDGRAIIRVASYRLFTVEAQAQNRARLFSICGGQSDYGTGISPSNSVLPPPYHFTALHSFIHTSPTLYTSPIDGVIG